MNVLTRSNFINMVWVGMPITDLLSLLIFYINRIPEEPTGSKERKPVAVAFLQNRFAELSQLWDPKWHHNGNYKQIVKLLTRIRS